MCLVLLTYCFQGVWWKSSMEDKLFFFIRSYLFKMVYDEASCTNQFVSALVSQFGTLILPLVVYMMIYERYLLNLVDWLLLVWRYTCETELVYSMGIILFYTHFWNFDLCWLLPKVKIGVFIYCSLIVDHWWLLFV